MLEGDDSATYRVGGDYGQADDPGVPKKGILVETGERGCKNGFTVVYRIDLAKVKALEMTGEPNTKTGASVDPVQTGPGTGARVACSATLLVNMRDIEPRKEDDGFDGAFLSVEKLARMTH